MSRTGVRATMCRAPSRNQNRLKQAFWVNPVIPGSSVVFLRT